jgi:hypothetical protein
MVPDVLQAEFKLGAAVTRGPGGNLEPLHNRSGISLLFAAGMRPTASDIERLGAEALGLGQSARISYRPPDDHGWIELLASGLTFDLRGLAPGSAAPLPQATQVYALPEDIGRFVFEAVSLAPGAHIAAGGALLPVIRTLLGLAAALVIELPVTAVCWNPAGVWTEPKYFSRIAINWLSGGPFPSLGLTSLRERRDGGLESAGLAYFVGQEVCVAPGIGAPGADMAKIAGRVADHLIRHGPLDRPERFAGLDGEALVLNPSPDGRNVVVARAA